MSPGYNGLDIPDIKRNKVRGMRTSCVHGSLGRLNQVRRAGIFSGLAKYPNGNCLG